MLKKIDSWVLIKLINQDIIIIYDAHSSVRGWEFGILYTNVFNTAVM